jgi:hypothetical protein
LIYKYETCLFTLQDQPANGGGGSGAGAGLFRNTKKKRGAGSGSGSVGGLEALRDDAELYKLLKGLAQTLKKNGGDAVVDGVAVRPLADAFLRGAEAMRKEVKTAKTLHEAQSNRLLEFDELRMVTMRLTLLPRGLELDDIAAWERTRYVVPGTVGEQQQLNVLEAAAALGDLGKHKSQLTYLKNMQREHGGAAAGAGGEGGGGGAGGGGDGGGGGASGAMQCPICYETIGVAPRDEDEDQDGEEGGEGGEGGEFEERKKEAETGQGVEGGGGGGGHRTTSGATLPSTPTSSPAKKRRGRSPPRATQLVLFPCAHSCCHTCVYGGSIIFSIPGSSIIGPIFTLIRSILHTVHTSGTLRPGTVTPY